MTGGLSSLKVAVQLSHSAWNGTHRPLVVVSVSFHDCLSFNWHHLDLPQMPGWA